MEKKGEWNDPQVKELMEQVEQADKKERLMVQQNLSTKQRLMRRLEHQTFQVEFEDDIGKFFIEVRMFSPKKQQDISNLLVELTQLNNQLNNVTEKTAPEIIKKLTNKSTKLMNKLYKSVASICVDPSFDYAYWRKGEGFTFDVPLRLLIEARGTSPTQINRMQKFRVK